MKTYRAMISVTMDSGSIGQDNAERVADGFEPLDEDDIRRKVADVLWEVIQDMVLDRQPFVFDYSVTEEHQY